MPDVELFAADLVFPEAPVWFDHHLCVSDLIGGGLHVLAADGTHLDTLLPERRGIGGAVVTDDGALLATGRDIADATTGQVVLERPPGSTGFNDIATDAAGTVLVGVLHYRPLAGDEPRRGFVAAVDSSGGVEVFDGADVIWPNGIGSLADGSVVVADFHTGSLHRVDGASGPRVIASSPSGAYDGLAVDDDDNIWVATGPGGSLEHRSPDGELLATVEVPAGFVSSACFSGTDPHLLFVTVAECDLLREGGAVLAFATDRPGSCPTPAAIATRR